ncbi:CYTH-like domain-containing protein [Lipomyces chichibuensis]|uniref:CYTH-like domain-containing protein n=1 Tax=Lipomyces chichibuensis TaxID=1546026 RepID=UPI0033443960
MDLRSIINADGTNSLSSPSSTPLAPPPPPLPHPPRRTSSIADLLDTPDTPPQIPSPTITSTSSLAIGTPTQPMLRAALSPRVSPTLVTRSLHTQTSSPTIASAQPPPFLSARSRSMSITSITAAEDVPSRRESVSSTGTTANGNRDEIKDESPSVSTMNSPEAANRQIKPRDGPTSSRIKSKAEVGTSPKHTKSKPRRYVSPPIYARKWTADWRSLYNVTGNGVNNGKQSGTGRSSKSPSPESAAHVFKREDGVHDDLGSSTKRERLATFTNVEPYEDLTRRVSSWIYANVVDMAPDVQNQIEIEAKIGTIMSKQTQQRLSLPVDTETLLNTDMLAGTIEFESDVGGLQHQAYNVFLNTCLQKSEQWKTPIRYSHTKQRDIFYGMAPQPGSNRRGERLRVSIDLKSEKVIQKIVKTRVRDLMIYFPGSKYDVRISLNIERPESMVPSPQDKLNNERVKDRVSYIHQNSQIDLTQVTAPDRKTHELEVELGMKDTLQHISRIKSGMQDDNYEEGIRRFLDNVRILVRRGGLDLKVNE